MHLFKWNWMSLIKLSTANTAKCDKLSLFYLATHRLSVHYHRPTVALSVTFFHLQNGLCTLRCIKKDINRDKFNLMEVASSLCIYRAIKVSAEGFVQFLWHPRLNCWGMLAMWDRKWGAAHLWLAGLPDPTTSVMAVPLGQGHAHAHASEYVTESRERTKEEMGIKVME